MVNEKLLIDANALKDSFCQACSTNKRYQRTDDECRSHRDSYGNGCFKMRLIDNAPTVDAVEVVRCKDCKSYVNRECKNLIRHMTNPCTIYTLPNDFCSYGERKDNEH